jgi:hypothetical protein
MGPWIDDTVILKAIAGRLSKAVADLEPDIYLALAHKANLDATADLATIMLDLGYTPAQLDSWDYVAVYAERLAIYFAFNTPPLNEPGVTAEKSLDCRDQLRKLTSIIIGGVAVAPAIGASAVGGVGVGVLDAVRELDHRLKHDWFR